MEKAEQQPGRPSIEAKLRQWYPELCSRCGAPKPRILIDGKEIEIEEGEDPED